MAQSKAKRVLFVLSQWKKKFFVPGRASFLLRSAAIAILLLIIGGSIAAALVIGWLSRTLPDPNNIRFREVPQSTQIWDREGKVLLYEIHGDQKRTVIDLSQIPLDVQHATIAIEDKDFYSHKGFRITSVFRAALANLMSGSKSQGASTLTQQLVKNTILTSQKTYTRKLKELFLSYEIERRFTKDEILKLYFNQIPYGVNAYGIEAASETYFGKHTSDLDLAEGAMIAAMTQAPSYYSPYGNHTDELKSRIGLVLNLMTEQGYITKDRADAAKKEDVLSHVQPHREEMKAPHFVQYIRDILTQKYGESMVETGGLKVITTLDWSKQQNAEKAITDNIGKVEKMGGSNAALVSLDPTNGQVLAMVGSRDYFDLAHDGNFNVAIHSRQPGSSFKPIVYAASFEKGYTPNTILYDVDTIFHASGVTYHPMNYDLKQHGPVTVRTALAGSLNIPAVKMLYLTGVNTALDFAERLGYTTFKDRSNFGLALVLGGAEVKPIEHAAAFATFATEGVLYPTSAILSVQDSSGVTLEAWKQLEGTHVMDPEVARNISSILSDNAARTFVFGAKNYLILSDRPVAAKTGTTNDFKDAWTVGYTPQLVAAVWTGNNDNTKMKTGADGSQIAAPIWQQYMRDSLKGQPVMNFIDPKPIVTGKPVLDGQSISDAVVKIDRATGLLATDQTPPSFVEEHHIGSAHSILFYVDKENPRGPVPDHPETDAEYLGWEAAVQTWVQKNSTSTPLENFVPPTGIDTVHVDSNKPIVSLSAPADNQTVSSRNVDVSVTATSVRGVARIEYLVDDTVVGSSTGATFIGTMSLPNSIDIGFHTFEVRAYDDVDNIGTVSVQINVTSAATGPTVFWASPSKYAVISHTAFPVTLLASLKNADTISRADFVVVSADGVTYRHVVGSINQPNKNMLVGTWSVPPVPGNYYVRLEVFDQNGLAQTLPDQVAVTIQ